MTSYQQNGTGQLNWTLWTQGGSNGAYWLEISIADTSGATQATATLNWTDSQGHVQSLSVTTKATDPQAYYTNTFLDQQTGQEVTVRTAALADGQSGDQTQAANITVKAGTAVTVQVVCSTQPAFNQQGARLSPSYTVEVTTTP